MKTIALEWLALTGNMGRYYAHTPFGSYFLWLSDNGVEWSHNFGVGLSKNISDNLEKAKKDCEDDFNKRFKECLC